MGAVPVLMAFITLTGCSKQGADIATVRVGVLPILDALPLYVADTQELFTREGLAVEFIPVASAAERDQLMQAGQIDITIADLVAVALYNREETQLIAVRLAMQATPEFAQFRILAAPTISIESAQELAAVEIGVSEATVIAYVTERMLVAEGLGEKQIATVAIPKIPERLALLNAGEIQAATLPEPLASLAIHQGASVIIDDRQYPQYGASVFCVREDYARANPEIVKRFLTAIQEASTMINADKGRWDTLLGQFNLVPAPIRS
ncbi:MAG: ABC transporter substrate-binding protein, partial [Anaerolineae bacterium]|nr:ABC transporter substrate-binding protein [Anaerolineae bacterium]